MEQGQFDLKFFIAKAIQYWYVFVIFLFLTMAGAWYYLQTTQPKYRISALLLIRDDQYSGELSQEALFAELGLGKKNRNLENEVPVLRSTPVVEKVVEDLGLQFQYFKQDGLIEREYYQGVPLKVLEWTPNAPKTFLNVVVEAQGEGNYQLMIEDKENEELSGLSFTGEFGKSLPLPVGTLVLTHNALQNPDWEGAWRILISPTEVRAAQIIESMDVAIAGEESSILSITLKDVSAERGRDILSKIIEKYNLKTIEDKTKVFENTITLINERIQVIAEELSAAEQNVEAYKRRYNMLELSSEGTLLQNEMARFNEQVANNEVQLSILESIEGFLEKNKETFEFVPTNLSVNNLTLTKQLENFNELILEKDKMLRDLGPAHPDFKLTHKQIQNLRETILDNIESMKGDMEIGRDANLSLRDDILSRMQSLPRRERELIEIERQKDVKENLYLYLLTKREESAISIAVSMPKGSVVEPPSAPFQPYSPVPAQIWLISIFLGLAMPVGVIALSESLNDKVQVEDELERLTTVPVAGMIAHHSGKERVVVGENNHSAAAEMFRLLRANLAYILPGKNLRTLLVTSSMSGEGKTYIGLNLCLSQALTGKKVLILELDLRRPALNIDPEKAQANGQVPGNRSNGKVKGRKANSKGVVNYLVDPTVTPEEIIFNTGLHSNFDIIRSGPTPPNPSELIMSSRLDELIEILKAYYDFILLDAPPVGLVADALHLKDRADATLYVVRAGYTGKGQLAIINNIVEQEKLPKPFIVLNGVRLNKVSGYGRGYRYGYGYSKGYNYYHSKK